jgi:CubicO group peptidase (beta-lactamase class C family)
MSDLASSGSRTRAAIEQSIASGLSPGAQIYISQNARVLADAAFGEARSGVPMTPNSLNLWMSSTKPVAAVAIAQLWERGLLELDDRVVRFIPEFGQNGKEPITIRHILTHTAGFRAPPRSQEGPWERIIAEVCTARLEPGWVPGRRAGYHPASSWYVLGEIVRRVDGRDYSRYVREEIFLPIGMRDSWVGMPAEQFEAYGDRIAVMHKITSDGKAVALDPRPVATGCRPGSGGWGPIRELGHFYEVLMRRGRTEDSGLRTEQKNPPPQSSVLSPRSSILSPQAVEAITARHRSGIIDETFKQPMDWGLGFLLNRWDAPVEVPYGYGPVASPRTFGHGGAESSGGLCDPERGLVVAYVFNGQPGEGRHHERRKKLLAAIEEDLAK